MCTWTEQILLTKKWKWSVKYVKIFNIFINQGDSNQNYNTSNSHITPVKMDIIKNAK